MLGLRLVKSLKSHNGDFNELVPLLMRVPKFNDIITFKAKLKQKLGAFPVCMLRQNYAN